MFGAVLQPNIGHFDLYGARFDFTAPDAPGVDITSSFFRIGTNNGDYAIGLVGDTGSTLGLTSLSLLALLAAVQLRRLRVS